MTEKAGTSDVLRRRPSVLLYLDQKDISSLAKGKVDPPTAAERLSRLLMGSRLAVVLSFPHVWETACDGNPIERQQISSYVDERLRPRVWLWQMPEIYSAELWRCMAEDSGATPPEMCPFSPTFYARSVGNAGSELHEFDVAVEELREQPASRELARNGPSRWSTYRKLGREFHGGQPIPDHVRNDALCQFVPKVDPTGRALDRAERIQYLERLDFSRCPALHLAQEVHDHYQRDTVCSIQQSEPWDYQHILAVPYCNMTTLDRRMHNVVLQTNAGKRYSDRIACGVNEGLDKLGL